MAEYPTDLPTFSTVDSTTPVASPLMTKIHQEVLAVATKVGEDSSAVTSTHDYKLSGLTGTEKAASDADLTSGLASGASTAASALAAHEADTSTHGVSQVADAANVPAKATATEVLAGTNDTKFATPLAVLPYSFHSVYQQAVGNGNFNVWQRGTSSTVTDASTLFLADLWRDYPDKNGGTLPTLTRSRQALTPGELPGSFFFSRLATSGAGSSFGATAAHEFYQIIEHGVRNLCGAGKSITISFYARSSITNKRLGVYIKQYYGSGGSPTSAEEVIGSNITLTSSWVRYSITIATNTLVGKTFGTENDDGLYLYIYPMWGSTTQSKVGASSAETYVGAGNIDIVQVQLNSGTNALVFQPRTFEEDLRFCQRYYEKSYDSGVDPGTATTAGSEMFSVGTNGAGYIRGKVVYRVNKRIAATPLVWDKSGNANKMTAVADNTSETANTSTYAIEGQGQSGFYFWYNKSSIYSGCSFNWTASAEI